jgi:flagellar motor component MotA
MYRFAIGVGIVTALLFLLLPWMVKSGSDQAVADWDARVKVAEQEVFSAMMANDNARINESRERLHELFPRDDAEYNQRIDLIVSYVHRARAQGQGGPQPEFPGR